LFVLFVFFVILVKSQGVFVGQYLAVGVRDWWFPRENVVTLTRSVLGMAELGAYLDRPTRLLTTTQEGQLAHDRAALRAIMEGLQKHGLRLHWCGNALDTLPPDFSLPWTSVLELGDSLVTLEMSSDQSRWLFSRWDVWAAGLR